MAFEEEFLRSTGVTKSYYDTGYAPEFLLTHMTATQLRQPGMKIGRSRKAYPQ